jgi:hypothetical protein
MARTPAYATKKELAEHKKEVKKMIKDETSKIKKWDVKQDKKALSTKKKK